MAVTTADGFKIPISIDDKASPGFDKMASRAKGLIRSMGILGGSVVVANQAFQLMGAALRNLNRLFDVTFGNFMKFEDALVGVGKTADLAGAELASLGDDFQVLSERIPKSAAELADIAKVAGQLGVKGSEDILRFTETMAKLESASNLAGEVGASQIARILNIVEGGVKNVDRFGSSIVALGNSFAATEAEIAHMATEVARSTAVFKPTSAQVLGLSTAMKALGIQAQLGGSAVGRAMREIQATIQTGAGAGFDTLQELTGIVGGDLKEAFETDATAVFQKFVEGLGSIDPSEITEKLEDLGLKGDEILKVLPVLATRSELLGQALQVANKGYEENVALNEEAEKAFRTLSSEMKKLGNQITNIAVDLSGEMAPALIEIIKLFRAGLTDAVKETKRVFDALVVSFNSIDWEVMIEAVTSLATAIGLVVLAMKSQAIIQFAANMIPIVISSGIAAANFLLMSGGILVAAAAIEIFVKNLDDLDALGESIIGVFNSLFERLKRGFNGLQLGFLLMMESIQEAAGPFAIFGDDAEKSLAQIRGEIAELNDALDENNESIEKADELLSEVSAGLDLGSIPTIFEEIKKGVASFNAELAKTPEIAGNANDSMEFDFDSGDFADSAVVEVTPKLKGSLFSDEDLKLISDAFGSETSGFASSVNQMTAVPLAMLGAANVMLDAAQSLIDAGPNLVNKVADIFTSLTDLPTKIVEAFFNLFDSITGLIANLIPNMIRGIGDLLRGAVMFLFEGIPMAFQQLADQIPDLIIDLLNSLPELANKLGIAFVRLAITLPVKMTSALIKAFPKVFILFQKAMPAIAAEFVEGVVLGLKEAANSIANAFGFDDIFNIGDLGKEFEDIGDDIAKSSSQLFSIVDLEASQRGLDLADKIRNAISSSGKEVAGILERLWEKLTAAWMWIRDNIIDPFIGALGDAWMWVRENIIDPLVGGLVDAWLWVEQNVVAPLVDGLRAVFDFAIKFFVDPIISAIRSLMNGIGGIIDGIVGAFTALFKGDFSGITDALARGFEVGLEGITNAFKALINPIIDLFNSLKLPEVKVSGYVLGKSFGFTLIPATDLVPGTIERLQNGGVAGVQSLQSGGIAGTDSVDASLTPGEFVVNRQSTQANLGLLKSINNAKGTVATSGSGQTTVNVVINTKTNLDKSSIKRELMPEIKKELKKESQRGVFIMSKRGLRA